MITRAPSQKNLNPSPPIPFTASGSKVPVQMYLGRAQLGVMATVMVLAGCSSVSNTADPVWSTLSGEDTTKSGSSVPSTTAPSESRVLPIAAEPANAGDDRRPLVIIRFYRPNVPYEEALYIAVSRALARRPDVVFDVVAVAPQADDPAHMTLHSDASKRNADNVFRSMTSMGVPAERVSLSATTNAGVQGDEIRLYVR
jgi:hypothetical protein